jgi:hypothetical protein
MSDVPEVNLCHHGLRYRGALVGAITWRYPLLRALTFQGERYEGDEVIEAANALRLDRLAPSHYGMWKGVGADLAALRSHAASFEYPRAVEPVEVGDRLAVDSPGVRPLRSLD